MIMCLLCGLGVIVSFKFSKEQQVWANWSLFTLKDNLVLGQNPAPETKQKPATSSVPPLWSSPAVVQEIPAKRSVQRPAASSEGVQLLGQIEVEEQASRRLPAHTTRRSSGVIQASSEQPEVEGVPRSLFAAQEEFDEAPPARPMRPVHPAAGEPREEFSPAISDPFAGGGLEAPASPRSARQNSIRQTAGTDDFGTPAGLMQLETQIPALPMETTIEPLQPAHPKVTELPALDPIPVQALPPQDHQIREQPRRELPPSGLPPLDPAPRQSMPMEAMPMESKSYSPVPDSQPIPAAAPMHKPQPARTASPDFSNKGNFGNGAPRQNVPVSKTVDTASDDVYQVQNGDNYWTISRRFYGSARFFSALSEYNKQRIPDPSKMRPGMYVLVPEMEVLHQNYPHLTGGGPRDSSADLPPGFFINEQGQPCYRIGKGDTLGHVAEKHLGRSSRWVQIYGLNKDQIPDGKTLKIGSVLRLPADAAQVSLAVE